MKFEIVWVEKNRGSAGIHTKCEDTHTLRLENKLSDLRVGYVHSTAVESCHARRRK